MTLTIQPIDPTEQGFYSKKLVYQGIPIKAHRDVADEALRIARDRLASMLAHLPDAVANLELEGVELHLIGKDQVTSDLPEHRHLKGKPFDGDMDVDQRTRGLGGQLTSCSEENLLKLPEDRYRGRDICVHEFAHALYEYGMSEENRKRIEEQYHRSLGKGLWENAYAATNPNEFLAELTMWYFGTHGDMGMKGIVPKIGREGLKEYDLEAYRLVDDLYTGRIPIPRVNITKLDILPSNREKTLRSADGGSLTTLRFLNRTDRDLQYFWIDTGGERHLYGEVHAGGRASLRTYSGHVWLLAGADGKAVALVVAKPYPGLAQIDAPSGSGKGQP